MAHRFGDKTKKSGWRLTVVASMAIVLVCAFSIGWFYQFLQDRLFAERQAFFTQFAEKTAENIELAINDYWHYSRMCQEFIAFSQPVDEAGLFSALDYCSDTISSGHGVVLAFTQDGEFYSSDGNEGWLGSESSLSFSSDAASRQTAIVNLPYMTTENAYFLLFSRMSEPVQIEEGLTVTHLALAVNVEVLQKQFSLHGFGDRCHAYFVTETGRKLYQSIESHGFVEGYNILTAIEDSARVVGGGTMEDLLASFGSGDTTAFEIDYQGEAWFVSFQTITSENHHLVVFAPTDLIGNNAAVLSRVSFWFLLLVCLLLGTLFAVVVFSVRTMMLRLKDMNDFLEEDAKAADQANRAKSEFLSYMSHDIRTPINGIMGMTGIAMRNEDDHAKVMDCLKKIGEASKHLLSLVNDVLDMSRIEQGKTAIVNEPVYLPLLLEECGVIVEGQLNTRDLTFVRDYDDLPFPCVVTDELHLRQILINILGNAVKFTPDGGTVSFRVRQTPVGQNQVDLLFEVEDTGIGMDASYLRQIWEPFSQSRQGHCSAYEGTGLGLAITKRFVDMMQGDISVESELGKGSLFKVNFTLEVGECEMSDQEPNVGKQALAGLSVLLVEDKELNREIAREILQEAGARVTCANNGAEALGEFLGAKAGAYDVVLMDVMMPVMDGLEATRAIRSSGHPDAETIPIVALTAHAFDEDVRRTQDAGMDCHLAKPINERELVRALLPYRPDTSVDSEGVGVSGCVEGLDALEGAGVRVRASGAVFLAEGVSESANGLLASGLRVLLAEDDPLNREIATVLLEEQGASVVAVDDGKQALDVFEAGAEGSFDAVLLDLHMPVMSGTEAVQRLRALKRADACEVALFVLTADCSSEERSAIAAAGADGVLVKPLDVRLLVQAVVGARSVGGADDAGSAEGARSKTREG